MICGGCDWSSLTMTTPKEDPSRTGRGEVEAVHQALLGDRNAGGLGDDLRLRLVHGERGSEHTGMGIGNFEIFEDTLDGSVLTEGTVQRIEGDIRLQRGKHACDVVIDIDARDLVAHGLERVGASVPRRKAHRPFRRKTTHQHRDMLYAHRTLD